MGLSQFIRTLNKVAIVNYILTYLKKNCVHLNYEESILITKILLKKTEKLPATTLFIKNLIMEGNYFKKTTNNTKTIQLCLKMK